MTIEFSMRMRADYVGASGIRQIGLGIGISPAMTGSDIDNSIV